MPTIKEISGARITVNLKDHPPPHVHVHHQGREVRLKITDAEPLDPVDQFPAGVLTVAREWLRKHRDIAANKWAEYHD